ncbi:NAD-dependent epimerase/dehydratase family protein, partial [Oceanospirillaceae bacterium]|nr:NAD-dependent epimerase/dehydratase family protein [Oceanospirillaceae bacterium]
MKVVLTGASGFLGGHICKALFGEPNVDLCAVVRSPKSIMADRVVEISDIGVETDWSSVLTGENVVIHAAAQAHIVGKDEAKLLTEYRRVNVDGTLNIARQAASSGVRRFIFISSIGVNGNCNLSPFTEMDVPCPKGLYAQSKWEAEQGLWEIQRETGMELV